MKGADAWSKHGYVFFLVFGGALGGLLMASLKVLNVPTDVPLREVWGWGEFSLWLVYVALAVLIAYGVGRLASSMVRALGGWRKSRR